MIRIPHRHRPHCKHRTVCTERGEIKPVQTFCGTFCSRCKCCGQPMRWDFKSKRWIFEESPA